MIARAAALSAVAAVASLSAACTTEHQVFGDDDVTLRTCAEVWASGQNDDACDFEEPCTRTSPADPLCCTEWAYCRTEGLLVMGQTCDPACVQCTDDLSCVFGQSTCQGTSCVPCLDAPGGPMCQECPPGWVYLTRNGCQTCECAPPNECTAPDGIPCGGDPNNLEQCYTGGRFADTACAPSDMGCRADVCSIPGCFEPAPLGCFTACNPTDPSCGTCATDTCECDPSTGTWTCTQICIDQYPQSLTCFL